LERILLIGGTSSLSTAVKEIFSEFAEIITAGRSNCDISLDLSDPAQLIKLPENIDVVIHTAAHFGGKTDTQILDAININVLGTLKLCQASVQAGAKHFIYISSIFSSLNETSRNFNIYSLSKKQAEELAHFYCSIHFLPLTILRPTQLYGSEESFRKHQPFFYMMIDKAERGEDIELYGSNDPYRNYLHIEDFAKVVVEVAKNKIQGIYSCANAKNITYSQIAKAAFDAFKSNGTVRFIKDKPNIPDNIFEFDNSLYEKVGFYPRISIEEGLKRIAQKRTLLK
jgi:nucleoside-diphosphate-sugar epimerase